jgi:hypothetical protein
MVVFWYRSAAQSAPDEVLDLPSIYQDSPPVSSHHRAGPGDLLLGQDAGQQLVDHLVADPPIRRHPESLPDPAAAHRPLDGVIDDLGRDRPGVPGWRAAPRLPSADLRSLYELAAILAGQPRRDPQPESLKLRGVSVQLSRGPALLRPASRRHSDLFRSGLHSSSDTPAPAGVTVVSRSGAIVKPSDPGALSLCYPESPEQKSAGVFLTLVTCLSLR